MTKLSVVKQAAPTQLERLADDYLAVHSQNGSTRKQSYAR
jgi:hypothetical protein